MPQAMGEIAAVYDELVWLGKWWNSHTMPIPPVSKE